MPPEQVRRGVDHPRAKLTEAQVYDIRRRVATGQRGIGARLAEEYGVTRGTITLIKQRKIWPHLPEECSP